MSAPATDSRAAILDAAESLFARQGFAATTIKQIAGAAGVNSALLYYYFPDKERLYHTVLSRLVDDLIATGTRHVGASDDPENGVRHFVAAQADFLLGHPNAPRLLVRELLDHDAAHAQAQIAQLSAGMFARLTALVRAGQERGVFRADLDPRFAAVSVIAQLAYVTIARPAIGILLAGAPHAVDDALVRRFADHAADFAVAALRTGSPPGSPP